MKPGVRITGGEFRGRGLAVPPGARPTEGRVREALFSIWNDRIEGARVLDLFAGSGVVGLEALGRARSPPWPWTRTCGRWRPWRRTPASWASASSRSAA